MSMILFEKYNNSYAEPNITMLTYVMISKIWQSIKLLSLKIDSKGNMPRIAN